MDDSRRNFLKTAVAIAASGVAVAALAESGEKFEGNPGRLGVLVDTTLCIGLNCRRCEIACARENGLPPIEKPPEDESVFESVRRTHANSYTVVNRFRDDGTAAVYVKKQCMHCDEPACASACLVGAFHKTVEGPVVYDASVCIGCRYCMVACPFDIPTYEYDHALKPRVRKCTFCYESRTKFGQAPACVEACPNEVMTFGKRSELVRLAYEKISAHPKRYVHQVYGEHEVGGTAWMYLSPRPFSDIGLREDLITTPYPELTRQYLAAAPLVMAMWPVFLGGIYLFTRRREELMKEEIEKMRKGGGGGEW